MNISNYYWYFSGVLTPRFCDEVIKYANAQKEQMAVTGGYGDRKLNKQEVLDLKRKRNSDLVWLNDTWIYKELHPYVHEANRNAGWNYEVSMYESLQFTCYEQDGHYGWHIDGGSDHLSVYTEEQVKEPGNPRIGKIRKLSMTLNLTDKTNYEGGNLEFDLGRHGNPQYVSPDVRTQGTIVVFPSFISHQITPVTSGTRYSLVLWALGEPFK